MSSGASTAEIVMHSEAEVTETASPTDLFAALAGPAVSEPIAVTIVRRNAKGEFQRLSDIPEKAAVATLKLDAEQRAYCRAVFEDRQLAMGVMLAERWEDAFLYGESLRHREREQTSELITIFRSLWEQGAYGLSAESGAFWPTDMVGPPAHGDRVFPGKPRNGETLTRPRVLGELAAVLSPEQCGEVERLVAGYWNEWIEWELRSRKRPSETDCSRARDKLERQVFADELRRAYDDLIKPYQEKLEKLFEAVEPTPEQRSTITRVLRDHIVTSRLRPRTEARVELMTELYQALDESRRAKLFGLVAAETAGGRW